MVVVLVLWAFCFAECGRHLKIIIRGASSSMKTNMNVNVKNNDDFEHFKLQ